MAVGRHGDELQFASWLDARDFSGIPVWQPDCPKRFRLAPCPERGTALSRSLGEQLMKMLVPYDKKKVSIEIDDRNFVGSLVSRVESYDPGKSQQ